MKKIGLCFAVLFASINTWSQSVGIGTSNPTKKLSVNGSIVVDHGNQNTGGADSASLLFGTQPALIGILSSKNPASSRYGGLEFFTNNFIRLSINQNGNIGIGTQNPAYKLHVWGDTYTDGLATITGVLRIGDPPFINSYKLHVNGNSNFNGTGTFTSALTVEGNITSNNFIFGYDIRSYGTLRADTRLAVGGVIDDTYRLRVYDGDARIGGEFHATGNSAIGGLPDANFRLRVYDGNSRFGGNVQVTGNLDAGTMDVNTIAAGSMNATNLSVSNSLTIDGKGSVRSNGPSSLRLGFDQKVVDIYLTNNNTVLLNANITDFSGSSDNVRVMISQISPDQTGTVFWPEVIVSVVGVDAAANTCIIALTNKSGNSGWLRGTIYLTSIAKD